VQAFNEISGINNNTFYQLNATLQGNNTVTLATAAQGSNFVAGNYVNVLNVFAQTTLSGSLASVAAGATGTMTMASAAGFPSTYPFYVLTDYDEDIEVTGLSSGTTYNIIRGVNGSLSPTPAHSSGAALQLVWSPAGVAVSELSTVTSSASGTGVLTLKNPLARAFSNAIIANVTVAAGHDITVTDLTMYCQQCLMVQNTFGFLGQRIRAITDGSGPSGMNAHFGNFNTNREVVFKDCDFLANASNMIPSDDPAGNSSQDIVFDNDTIVAGGFGSAEYPAHYTVENSRLWLAPVSGAVVGFSLSGYDMKAVNNSIWVAPATSSSMVAVTDGEGLSGSNYQWFGNVVFANNDISASGPAGSTAVGLKSTGATLSGGHINVNSSGMRAVATQDFAGQLPGIIIDHVGMEGCTGGYCVFDNQQFSGYDAFTFTDNTLGGSSVDAIYVANPGSPNAGRGRITGNTSYPGSSFGTFLSWTPSNHPGILSDDGLENSLVDLASTQSLTNKTIDAVSPTTLGYLDATSSVQTQLNSKQNSASANSNNAGIGNCSSGQYETGTAAGSSQPCAQVQYSQLGGTTPTWNQATTGNAATATGLAASPSQAPSGQYCTGVTAAGNCNGAQVQFSQVGGTVAATQLPSTAVQMSSSAFQLIEDFVGGSGATSTTIGTHGWAFGTIGSASTFGEATSTWNHPGIVTIATVATSGDGTYLYLGEAQDPTFGPLGANSPWTSEWIAYISTTSNLGLRIGFGSANQATKIPANGIYFRYDTGSSDSVVQACVSNSSTETCSSTGVSLTANTFADFYISSTTTGTISFAVNTSSPVTLCSSGCTASATIPAVAVTPVVSFVTLTNAAATVGLDYFNYSATGLTR